MADPIDDTTVPAEEPEEQSAVQDDQQEFLQEDDETSLEDRVIHKLQSWQGRREKEQEDKLYGRIAELFNKQQRVPVQQPYQPEDPEPDPDLDVRQWYDWRQRQDRVRAVTQQQAADQAYFGTINTVRHSDDAIHEATLKEIQHNQNMDPYTGQPMTPSADAMLNYNNALRRILESRLAPPSEGQNPLASNQPPPRGLGVSQPAQQMRSAATMPRNLSPEAQKLINRSGWNADKVRKVLEKNV
uniref:Uncharacterized protein n=1 Tax=viral metagenome TaxID=1070528 RepID=A0A6M3LHV9_9ZZZZ